MRQTITYILSGLVCVLCFGHLGLAQPLAPATSSISVGFITPLTGSRASIGQDARLAALLAVEDLEKTGQLKPGQLAIQFEDSQGDPLKGVNAFKSLVASGVRFVITQNSNVSIPIQPLAIREGVIQLAITTTADKFSSPNDLSFRTNGPTTYEGVTMADFIAKSASNAGKVAVVTMQDEYPVSLESHLLKELLSKGITPVYQGSVLPQDSDFRTIIAQIKAKNASVVAFLGYQAQAGIFAKQARELGLKSTTLVFNVPVNNSEFFATAGAAAEGSYVVYIKVNQNHPAAKRFLEKNGKPMNLFASNAYDAVVLTQMAFSKCEFKANVPCLTKALYSIKNYNGASGLKSFDDTFGDMEDQYEILVAKDGKFTL